MQNRNFFNISLPPHIFKITCYISLILAVSACQPPPDKQSQAQAPEAEVVTQVNQAPDIYSKDDIELSPDFTGALPIFISDSNKDALTVKLTGPDADVFALKGVAIFFADDQPSQEAINSKASYQFTITVSDQDTTSQKQQLVNFGSTRPIEDYARVFSEAVFTQNKRSVNACIPSTRNLKNTERFYKDYIQLLAKPSSSQDYSLQKTFSVNPVKNQLCLSNLKYGHDYIVSIKKGFPFSAVIAKSVFSLSLSTPDQAPSMSFGRGAFILPHSSDAQIPLELVNVSSFEIIVTRMSVEQIKLAFANGQFEDEEYVGRLERVIEASDLIGREKVDVELPRNTPTTLNVDLSKVFNNDRPAGAYSVIVVPNTGDDNQRYWDKLVIQKVIYTDIGLVTYQAKEGLYVYSMSYDKGAPVARVKLSLIAENSEVLGSQVSDSKGKAFFPNPLLQGKGGMAPAQVRAIVDNELAFIDFNMNKLDLSHFDISGNPALGPVNGFVSTERGVYRNGEQVFVQVMLRDSNKKALTLGTFTLDIYKASGEVIRSTSFKVSSNGVFQYTYKIPQNERTGKWSVKVRHGDEDTANVLGQTSFEVADYIPQTIAMEINTERTNYDNTKLAVSVKSDYLYGAPASELGVESSITFSKNRRVFNAYPDFIFGDDSQLYNKSVKLSNAALDKKGELTLHVPKDLLDKKYLTQPLSATLRVGVEEDSGRINYKNINMTALYSKQWIGIKQAFDDATFGLNQPIKFAVISLNKEAEIQPNTSLSYRIIEEEHEYHWYRSGDQWKYRVDKFDKDIADYGEIATGADGLVNIDFTSASWGHYRLEVENTASGQSVNSSFSIGWSGEDDSFSSPEKITLSTDKENYLAGDNMMVQVESPYPGKLHLVLANDNILFDKWLDIPANTHQFPVKIKQDWGDQFYLTAMVYRAQTGEKGPARAVGLHHVTVKQPEAKANIILAAEDKIRPNSALKVSINSSLEEGGEVIVMAVDKGILNLTNYKTPDPFAHYFAKRTFGVPIYDLYQHLIQYKKGEVLSTSFGGDANLQADATLRENVFNPTVLVSEAVLVDKNGQAEVTLDVPQFNGQLQIMALGADSSRIGASEHKTVVASPVAVASLMPRFAHLQDTLSVGINLHNLSLKNADIKIQWKLSDGLELRTNKALEPQSLQLPLSEKGQALIDIEAIKTGLQKINAKLTVNGEDFGQYSYNLKVENLRPKFYTSAEIRLPANQTTGIRLDKEFDLDSVTTQHIKSQLSTASTLNVAHFVHQLRRYPLACLEQTTSKAWAFLNADGAISPVLQKQLLQSSIEHLGALQQTNGGFALWENGNTTEPWLSMYAIDMMLNVNKAFKDEIPNNLLNDALAYANKFNGRSKDAKVYAQYISASAQAQALNKGEVRYLSNLYITKQEVPSVQTVALLLLTNDLLGYSDNVQALYTLLLSIPNEEEWSRDGYTSAFKSQILRAFVVSKARHLDAVQKSTLQSLISELKAELADKKWISTHEKAWLLRLSHGMKDDTLWQDEVIALNDSPITQESLAQAINSNSALATFTNTLDKPVFLNISIDGISEKPLAANRNNIQLKTEYLSVDGSTTVDISAISQGTEVLVKHSIKLMSKADAELSLDAPIPAGFELENPKLSGLRQIQKNLSTTPPTFEEYRDSRYLAAWTLPFGAQDVEGGIIHVHYIMRAVSKGRFVKPAIVVEDMYRPEVRANSAEGIVVME